MLSVPVAGQFEQVMNARYLERMGYGGHAPAATAGAVGDFLERLPDARAALAATPAPTTRAASALDGRSRRPRARQRRLGPRRGVTVVDAGRVVCAAWALLMALVEIEIEGRHGWALGLPTWFRTRGRPGALYGSIGGPAADRLPPVHGPAARS